MLFWDITTESSKNHRKYINTLQAMIKLILFLYVTISGAYTYECALKG
jgi:hypothetical protein